MNSSTAPRSSHSSRGSAANSPRGTVTIHCRFCHNTFRAAPCDAVCLKCKRPANAPLSWPGKLLCLILFPLGAVKAVLMRASQPYAAMQALAFSLVGGALWGAAYLLMQR